MGADGGTIPKRCELIRNKKKKEKVRKDVVNVNKLRTCQSSQEPLKKPIVACKLGRLYNKEAIIEARLNKTLSTNEATKHIKSLHDVKELRLTDNRAYKDCGPENGDTYTDFNETPYVCPVTSLGMNGINIFVVNWLCGCVFSERAIQELKSSACYGCGGPLCEEKLMKLFPDAELLEIYKQRIADEHSQKRSKKAEKPANAKNQVTENQSSKKSGVKPSGSEIAGQKRKLEPESMQSNPNISKAVKAMFTTSEEAKNQKQGHWVTHNPLYY